MFSASRDQLTSFYDLAVTPCSFDFFSYLVNAEICRKRRGLSSIRLIFVKGPNKGFRQDKRCHYLRWREYLSC